MSSHILPLGLKIFLIAILSRYKDFMQGGLIDSSHMPSLRTPLLLVLGIKSRNWNTEERVFIA